MKTAIFPGSFDPPTNGHLALIRRGAALFDSLIVLVMQNGEKKNTFTPEERVELLQKATDGLANVTVRAEGGLLCRIAAKEGAVLLKGVRNGTDFAYEEQMAAINRALTGTETLLLPAEPETSFISSTMVRDVARHGGDISAFVPEGTAEIIYQRMKTGNR